MTTDVRQIGKIVEEKSEFIRRLLNEFDKVIIGQKYMLERMLAAILSNGHILIEGVPGSGQDHGRNGTGKGDQCSFQPDSVYTRPAAGGPDGNADLPAVRRRIPGPQGADFCQYYSGR